MQPLVLSGTDKKRRGWDKSPSLSILFGLSSKTQWLSGLYYADFISFYSPTQLCGGRTTKSNSNELPISVPLSLFSRYYSLNPLMNFEVPLVSYRPDSLNVFIRRLLFIPKKFLVRQLDAVAVWFLHSLFKLRRNLISFAGVELRTKVLFHSHPLL